MTTKSTHLSLSHLAALQSNSGSDFYKSYPYLIYVLHVTHFPLILPVIQNFTAVQYWILTGVMKFFHPIMCAHNMMSKMGENNFMFLKDNT